MQAADRGFATVLSMTFPAAEELEARRSKAYRGFVELIARAKATGHLQADFTPEDLVVLLMANAGVIAATADAAPDSWRRLVGTDAARVRHPRRPDSTDAPSTSVGRPLPRHDRTAETHPQTRHHDDRRVARLAQRIA